MPPDGKIILIERLLPDQVDAGDEGSRTNLLLDVSMLVLNGGCERTEDEYKDLLAQSGLRLNSTVATQGPQSIIEAVPA
jgi:hypothetical protein